VKTVKFAKPTYVGDPINAVRIFNEREVDELIVLDIMASRKGTDPQEGFIKEIVSEAFMPVAYGGGIRDIETARRILSSGVEKIVVTTHALEHPAFVTELAREFGNQSIVVTLDIKTSLFGKREVYTHCGEKKTKSDPVSLAIRMEELGAGELMLNSIDRDGTMQGFDTELLKQVTSTVTIPVIACGGAGTLQHLQTAVTECGASAVAAGSLFVFQGKHRSVLINYPDRQILDELFTVSNG
jgi:cyclase